MHACRIAPEILGVGYDTRIELSNAFGLSCWKILKDHSQLQDF